MKSLWICLIALVCIASAGANIHRRLLRRQERTTSKDVHDYGIVGGDRADIKKYPYTVSITYDPQKYLIGGGAILNKNWVVCSAYEIMDYASQPEKLSVRAGSDKAGSGGQKVNVSKIIIHESFVGYYQRDIALIKTGTEINLGKQAKPVKLPTSTPEAKTKARVTGFGSTMESNGCADLHVATVHVKSSDACASEHGYLGDTCLCADAKGVGPCYSDFGDPLVRNKELLGFYIGGDMCNYYDLMEIYSNVAALKEWILEKIKENSDADQIQGIDDEGFYRGFDDDDLSEEDDSNDDDSDDDVGDDDDFDSISDDDDDGDEDVDDDDDDSDDDDDDGGDDDDDDINFNIETF